MPRQKRTIAPGTTNATVATPTPVAVVVALSKRTSNAIESVRQPFASFASGFAALTADRATLAPKFMKAFGAWQAETAGTFVGFVRLFDATVPEERTGYRSHAVYQAADYLRRLVAQQERPAATNKANKGPAPVRPIEAVARLVATLSPFVADMDLIWKAFLQELHWTDRQIASVQKLVGQAGPLLTKQNPREHKLHVLPKTGTAG